MRSFVFTLAVLALVGCAANPVSPDGGRRDAQAVEPDGGTDAATRDDAGAMDAGSDAGPSDDAGASDAGGDAGTDAGRRDAGAADAGATDAGSIGCTGISVGDTIALDGAGDLAKYPSDQLLAPGAPLSSGDQVGITWDATYVYVTVASTAFSDPYKPVHIYLETASGTLPSASPGTGKEYATLSPAFAFTPSHVIAVRATSDSGTGGPYNGVYTAATAWATRTTPIDLGVDYWVPSSSSAISVRVPWSALGCPTQVRLSAHVVNQALANEWKDLVPAGAQPWNPSGGPGAYYEIDLGGDPAISGWTLVP
jgi:hypothetical protein